MSNTIINAVNILFNLLEYAIFIDVILSWFLRGRTNAFVDILHIFTEPFMAPARRLQEKLFPSMMLDFSPIIAYFVLVILRTVIISIIGMFI